MQVIIVVKTRLFLPYVKTATEENSEQHIRHYQISGENKAKISIDLSAMATRL